LLKLRKTIVIFFIKYTERSVRLGADKIIKMSEFWDIYDEKRNKTGRIAERGGKMLEEGEYHLVVRAIILNSKNEILLTQRAEHKKYPLMWECSGGAVLAGETSLDGMIREVKEELGLTFSKKDAIFLKEIKRDLVPPSFKSFWVFKKELKDEDITLPDGEAIQFKWVSIQEFLEMIEKDEIVPTIDWGIEEYEQAIKIEQRQSYNYIGQNVEVEIDRPLNSRHPKHGFTYELNYGYVPNTTSGDGEEIDCYVLGIDEPIATFKGKCIAVIHRTNDVDDKIIIALEGESYTDEQIRELTNFQEQYFESEIIR